MSEQIIDVEVVSETPKLLPPIPMCIVCKNCKQETGYTKEDIMKVVILDDIICPSCNVVVIPCCPQRNLYSWQTNGSSSSSYNEDWMGD